MNNIVITCSYITPFMDIRINTETVSPYSELATIAHRPFHQIANILLKEIDNEVFDDYEIDCHATTFQYEILKHYMQDSEFCQNIYFHDITKDQNIKDITARLFEIGNCYGVDAIQQDIISVYFDTSCFPLLYENFIQTTNVLEAAIGVFETEEAAQRMHLPWKVILDEGIDISYEQETTVAKVSRNTLSDFWEFYYIYQLMVPYIERHIDALKYKSLNEEHQIEITFFKTGKPAYYMSKFPSVMEVHDSTKFQFHSYPVSSFTIECENPSLLSYENDSLTALHKGSAQLLIKNQKNEIVQILQTEIIEHQYISQIQLVPDFTYLKVHDQGKIDVISIPSNAEDANSLTYESSDPTILQINPKGIVTALREGHAEVRINGEKVSAELPIEVKPILQSIHFAEPSIRLKTGEQIIIECMLTPPNALSEGLTWSLDNKTIASCNPSKDGKKCKLTAALNYEGKGNIRCYDADSNLSAICNFEIYRRSKQTKYGKTAIACWIIGIFLPFLLPISAAASIWGLTHDLEAPSKKTYIICAIGSLMTLFVWLSQS